MIVLKEDGFYPDSITIEEGDTVTFTTTIDSPFWPASNVHPTHTAYPDFDPKRPVAKDDTWSFTFTEAGVYKFHDHINALFEGVVYVGKKKDVSKIVDCENDANVQCWERLMLQTLEEEGVEAAFSILVDLSETEPAFTRDCHGYGHLIGEGAYDLYVANEKFELTPATALCGYGFYHGFMETLLLTTGNIQEARNFCAMADQELTGQRRAVSSACYHGTGHGAVDGSDPTTWGDIDAMMEPGFRLCDALAENELQLYLCDTGVFNAIEILSRDPKYKINYIHDEPFALCNQQPLERREACYSNMLPLLLWKFNDDFEQILAYTQENMIDNQEPAVGGHTIEELVTIGAMFEFIRVYGHNSDYAERGVEICRKQNKTIHAACIEGLSGGHMKYGPPEREYIKNLTFCASNFLTEEERDSCYRYPLKRLMRQYSVEQSREICRMVDVQYAKKYCAYY